MNEKEKKIVDEYYRSENERIDAFSNRLREEFPILWRKDSKQYEAKPCVGKGWEKILLEMSQEISDAIESINQLFPLEQLPIVVQVKEKFGGLRVYVHNQQEPVSDVIRNIIDRAEAASFNTCEKCGEPGQSRGRWPDLPHIPFGWVLTLCESCWYKEAEFRVMRGYGTQGQKEVRRWYHERTKARKAKENER